MGKGIALSIVAASIFLQNLSKLPQWQILIVSIFVLSLSWMLSHGLQRVGNSGRNVLVQKLFVCIKRTCILFLVFTLSLAWATWRAQARMADHLFSEHENVVTRVPFQIVSLVQDQGDSLRFEAEVLPDKDTGIRFKGVPRHIQVAWRKPKETNVIQSIRPGQIWRAALIFRQPRGALNPHGFDFEAHLLSRNIRAIGRVRGHPVLLAEHPFDSMQVMVSGARQYLRLAMRQHIGEMTFGAVLIALAIGDQDSVRSEHWNVFNKTGITHLVSISGSHVTMLAAFGGLSMLWCWKRLRWRGQAVTEIIPAKVMAGVAALFVAWLYCLLAGWGVPARRTFFMLLVSGCAMMSRLPMSASGVLCLAAAVVTVIDPWSPVSTGFWLSFGAVAVLFYVGAQSEVNRDASATLQQRIWRVLKESARLQWMITLAMLPALAYLFQEVSVISPLANAIAIPVITFVVTPLALAMALISLVPGLEVIAACVAWAAHMSLEYALVPITWLAHAPGASFTIAAMPLWCLVLSLVGIVWALQPKGLPARWVGWTLLLPGLTWQPQTLPPGGWQLIALDVGQGSAIIVRTQRHVVLFDVGPRLGDSDAGQRVVAPVMRALGIKSIHAIVISHSDVDHAGGLPGLLRQISVASAYTSFDLEHFLNHNQKVLLLSTPITRPREHLSCEKGKSWEWDGVTFSFLHPEAELSIEHIPKEYSQRKKKIKTNAQSCVLHIQGAYHSALLPGDIGVQQEKALLIQDSPTAAPVAVKANIVMVAHHGSTSSSSPAFIAQLQAQHAIAQVGYLNRFSHPAPEVEHRWKTMQAKFWRTDRDGAVTAESNEKGLFVYSQAQKIKRYWHQRD